MDAKTLTGLLVLSVALAGCSSDDDAGPSPQEQCAMDVRLWTGAECIDHTEPSILVDGIGATVSAYVSYPFTWTLDNGTYPSDVGQVHSMYSALVAVTDGTVPTNLTDAETDSPGMDIAVQTHQNLPVTLEGTFVWETSGQTLDLWGYMRIDGENIWQQISQIAVQAPPATGTTHTVSISLDPAAGGVAHDGGSEVALALGDAIEFANGLPYEYAIDLSDCDAGTLTAAGQGTSDKVTFLEPMVCEWTGSSPLAASGAADPLAISGKIRVSA